MHVAARRPRGRIARGPPTEHGAGGVVHPVRRGRRGRRGLVPLRRRRARHGRPARALPRSTEGLVGSSDRFAMCGTASPDAASFERVPCSAKHTWVAVSTVPLTGKSYPSASAAGDQMESACRCRCPLPRRRPARLHLVRGAALARPVARGPALRDLLGARLTSVLVRRRVWRPAVAGAGVARVRATACPRHPRVAVGQKPSLRSWRGSRCQSLAILTCRSR